MRPKRVTVAMDEQGRITIPDQYQRTIGAKAGDEFLLALQDNRAMSLRLVQNGSCCLCRSQTGLVHTAHGDICQPCVKEIIESVAQHATPVHMCLK